MCRDVAGERVLVASWTGTVGSQQKYAVRLWDAETGEKWSGLPEFAENVFENLLDLNLALSVDRQTLAAPWNARRTEEIRLATINLATFELDYPVMRTLVDEKSGRYVQHMVDPQATAPTADRLVNASGILEASKRELLLPLERMLDGSGLVPDGDPLSFDWSPDGKRIAIVVGKGVRVLTVADGSRLSPGAK
jgi:hypothetical protein